MAVRPLYRIFNSLYEKSHTLWTNDMDIKVYFNDLIGDYNRLWHEIDNYADTIDALEKTNINLLNDKKRCAGFQNGRASALQNF